MAMSHVFTMFFTVTLLKYILYKKTKYYQDLKNILDWYILCREYSTAAKLLHIAICKKGVRENQMRITTDFVNMLSV